MFVAKHCHPIIGWKEIHISCDFPGEAKGIARRWFLEHLYEGVPPKEEVKVEVERKK